MDNFIKIAEQLDNSCLLFDGATVKKEIKRQEGGFLGAMMAPVAALLIAPMVSSLINPLNGKRVMENGRNICASFDKKKSRFIKIQEASRLKLHYIIVSKKFRASKIANKFLFAGDKFMPKYLLRQPGISYNACRPFTKHLRKDSKILRSR